MLNINKGKALIICNLILIIVLCSSVILNYKLYQLYVFHEKKHSSLEYKLFTNTYEIPTIQRMTDTESLINAVCTKKTASYEEVKTLKENLYVITDGLYHYIDSFIDTYANDYYGKTIFNIQPPDIYNTNNYRYDKLTFNTSHYFFSASNYFTELDSRTHNNSSKYYKEIVLSNKDVKKLTIIKNVIRQCQAVLQNACYKCEDIKKLSERIQIRFKAIKKLGSLYNEYKINKKIDERYTENGFENSPFNPLNK